MRRTSPDQKIQTINMPMNQKQQENPRERYTSIDRKNRKSHLPQTLGQPPLSKLPGIKQPLLRQIDILHIRRIRRRGTADARGDQNRVRLEDNTVVDDLVDSQGDEVVVFDDGAFVRGASVLMLVPFPFPDTGQKPDQGRRKHT